MASESGKQLYAQAIEAELREAVAWSDKSPDDPCDFLVVAAALAKLSVAASNKRDAVGALPRALRVEQVKEGGGDSGGRYIEFESLVANKGQIHRRANFISTSLNDLRGTQRTLSPAILSILNGKHLDEDMEVDEEVKTIHSGISQVSGMWSEIWFKHRKSSQVDQSDLQTLKQPSIGSAVIEDDTFVKTLIREWQTAGLLRAGTILNNGHTIQMAAIAAKLARDDQTQREIKDDESGLTLPLPKPPVKYEDRPKAGAGRRPNIEEWLRNDFWQPYSSRKLISGGELKLADASAYKALHRRAQTISEQSGESLKSVRVRYFLENGVLADELIDNPPEDLQKQVALIKRAQALRMLMKAESHSKD